MREKGAEGVIDSKQEGRKVKMFQVQQEKMKLKTEEKQILYLRL